MKSIEEAKDSTGPTSRMVGVEQIYDVREINVLSRAFALQQRLAAFVDVRRSDKLALPAVDLRSDHRRGLLHLTQHAMLRRHFWILQPRWNVALSMQNTPYVDVIGLLKIEDDIRESLQRHTAQIGQTEFICIAQ